MLEEREGKSFSIDEQQSRRIGPNSWIIYLFVNWIVANEGLEGNAISNRFFISPLLDSRHSSMKIHLAHENVVKVERDEFGSNNFVFRRPTILSRHFTSCSHTRVSFPFPRNNIEMQIRRIDFRIVGRMRRRMDGPKCPQRMLWIASHGGNSFVSLDKQRWIGVKRGREKRDWIVCSDRLDFPTSVCLSCSQIFRSSRLETSFFVCGEGEAGIVIIRPSLRKIENDERCREFRDKSSCSRGQ